MNIFVLSLDPAKAAEYHCDKHVNKMILEAAQMLSTAHRVLDGEQYVELSKAGRRIKRWKLPGYREGWLYKASHVNHPCNIWLRESAQNYIWLYKHFEALYHEKVYRTGVGHKSWEVLHEVLKLVPARMPTAKATPFAQAMPDEYKNKHVVTAYRDYYLCEKTELLQYTRREQPFWVTEIFGELV